MKLELFETALGADFAEARPHRRAGGRAELPLAGGIPGAEEGRALVHQSGTRFNRYVGFSI